MRLTDKKQGFEQSAGQSTIEMIMVIGFILLIFIVVSIAAHYKIIESNEFKTKLDAKRICNSVADNINTISEQGSGYYCHFEIPPEVHGGYEYNITVNGNIVEITCLSGYKYIWSTQVITSNVTVFCLDKGDKKNRVFNDDGGIIITCNRPDLKPVIDTLKPIVAANNTNITVSIDVINFGPVDSGQFTVLFDTYAVNVSGLAADQTITVVRNMTTPVAGDFYVLINVDSNNWVNESIETNNIYNGTIRIAL